VYGISIPIGKPMTRASLHEGHYRREASEEWV
jgi:hypothetical protein